MIHSLKYLEATIHHRGIPCELVCHFMAIKLNFIVHLLCDVTLPDPDGE